MILKLLTAAASIARFKVPSQICAIFDLLGGRMAHETIRKKHTDQMTVKPNLLDVEQVRKIILQN